jgi:hypothetical protein
MLTLNRVRLGAALAVPGLPDTGERPERPILTERERDRRLSRFGIGVFAKRRERRNGSPV